MIALLLFAGISVSPIAAVPSATPKMAHQSPELYKRTDVATSKRVDDLLARLTLADKISLMSFQSPAIAPLGLVPFDWAGKTVEDEGFPCPLGLAASFDSDLVQKVFLSTAKAAAPLTPIVKGPSVDLLWEPRWPDAAQTFGEDPALVTELAAAAASGVDVAEIATGLDHLAAAACLTVLHPIAPQDADSLSVKSLSQVEFDELAQRIFVTGSPFVSVQIPTVVYESPVVDSNGERGASHGPLGAFEFVRALRNSEKYPGVLGLVRPPGPAVPKPTDLYFWVQDGIDLFADDAIQKESSLLADAKAGRSGTSVIEASLRRSLALRLRLPNPHPRPEVESASETPPPAPTGVPTKVTSPTPADAKKSGRTEGRSKSPVGSKSSGQKSGRAKPPPSKQSPSNAAPKKPEAPSPSKPMPGEPKSSGEPSASQIEHDQLALRAARESIVLLKNDNDLLPLKPSIRSIAVIGPNADDRDLAPKTPLQALKDALGTKVEVHYARGCGFDSIQDFTSVSNLAIPGGWHAEYFPTLTLDGDPVIQTDKQLSFVWAEKAPAPGIKPEKFSVRWTGTFIPAVSGPYTLGYVTDDAARMSVDGVPLVENWDTGTAGTFSKQINLTAGDIYVVSLEYQHHSGPGAVRLVWAEPEPEPFHEALDAARRSDVAVLFLGSKPGLDVRKDIALPEAQESLLEAVASVGKPVVLVMTTGGPISCPWAKSNVPAILQTWYSGPAGPQAIADALLGNSDPSGRLPVTIYQTREQLPGLNEPAFDRRTYRFSLYRPLFPFGFGLSYTRFEYSGLSAPRFFGIDRPTIVSVNVKNAGHREADEIVELYVTHPVSKTPGPRIELKKWKRVHLKSGESRTVSLTLQPEDLARRHADGNLWIDPERVRIYVGGKQPLDSDPSVLSTDVMSDHATPVLAHRASSASDSG